MPFKSLLRPCKVAIARGIPGLFQSAMRGLEACSCEPEGLVGRFTHTFLPGPVEMVQAGPNHACFFQDLDHYYV